MLVLCGAGKGPGAASMRNQRASSRSAMSVSKMETPERLERNKPEQLFSNHPDALTRRLVANQRKMSRRIMSETKTNWWQINAPNSSTAMTHQDYMSRVRVARNNQQNFVVNFFSPNCGACKKEALRFLQIAAENPSVEFIRVHYEQNRLLAQQHNVIKLPWIQYYDHEDGIKIEDYTMASFEELLNIPKGYDLDVAQYCNVGSLTTKEEFHDFNSIWQAIHL